MFKKPESLQIQYDTDYGINRRSGWSISVNGSFTAELEPSLLHAILKTVKRIRRWED